MKQLVIGPQEKEIKLKVSFAILIDSFLSSQDIKGSSKTTYQKALKRFMN